MRWQRRRALPAPPRARRLPPPLARACAMATPHVRNGLAAGGCPARPLALAHDGQSPVDALRLRWVHGATPLHDVRPASAEEADAAERVLLDLLALAGAACALHNPASSFGLNARYLREAGLAWIQGT